MIVLNRPPLPHESFPGMQSESTKNKTNLIIDKKSVFGKTTKYDKHKKPACAGFFVPANQIGKNFNTACFFEESLQIHMFWRV